MTASNFGHLISEGIQVRPEKQAARAITAQQQAISEAAQSISTQFTGMNLMVPPSR